MSKQKGVCLQLTCSGKNLNLKSRTWELINISMRTVCRYLHNCKDDFSRMRVQKFSTAGQQIAMTKTSISVTFDNLAKLVYSLTASYEIGADCLWVADETSVQRDTNQCKHRKVIVRNHGDHAAAWLSSKVSNDHISLMSAASAAGTMFDPCIVHAKAPVLDSVNLKDFSEDMKYLGLREGQILSNEKGSFLQNSFIVNGLYGDDVEEVDNFEKDEYFEDLNIQGLSQSDGTWKHKSFYAWALHLANTGHKRAKIAEHLPVILILDK